MTVSFRTTQRAVTNTSLAGLQDNLNRLQRIQEQLSSGKQLSRPSDSPTGTVAAMQLRSEQQRNEQYTRNADDGLSRLGAADNALSTGLGYLRRIRDLTLQGMNASTDATGRAAIAAEVGGLRSALLDVGNAKFLNRPIFAGTKDVPVAYDASGAYQGNDLTTQRTVAPGTMVEVNMSAKDIFGAPGSDVFATAAGIIGDLGSNPAGLTARLGQLDSAMQAMQNQLSLVGARYNRVDTARTAAESRRVDLASSLSEVESIDLPKTVMEMQMQQVAYQAALGATAKVIQPTLMDYLR